MSVYSFFDRLPNGKDSLDLNLCPICDTDSGSEDEVDSEVENPLDLNPPRSVTRIRVHRTMRTREKRERGVKRETSCKSLEQLASRRTKLSDRRSQTGEDEGP
jgi:hypothetical protein